MGGKLTIMELWGHGGNRQREGDDKENTKEIEVQQNSMGKELLFIIFVYRLVGFLPIDLGKCNTVGCVHLHIFVVLSLILLNLYSKLIIIHDHTHKQSKNKI